MNKDLTSFILGSLIGGLLLAVFGWWFVVVMVALFIFGVATGKITLR